MTDTARDDAPGRYLALNCTLKRSPERSSTDRLLGYVTGLLDHAGLSGSTLRVVDHDVAFGVSDDEGDGDGWPEIRRSVLDSDLLVLGTPIWLGHPASVCQVVLERLDAMITETDDRDQQVLVDKLALLAVVGNEDGAHHVGAELQQGLNDVGFTFPPGAMTYWVGEAMGRTDLIDLDEIPDCTASTARTMVTNAVHLLRRLRGEGAYPRLPEE